MTNRHWSFSIRDLKSRCGFERLLVLNDFTALALALPALRADETAQVGGGAPRPEVRSASSGQAPGSASPAWCRTAAAAGCRSRARAATQRWPGRRRASAPCSTASAGGSDTCRPSARSAARACSTSIGRSPRSSAPAAADITTSADVTERALAGRDAICVEALDAVLRVPGHRRRQPGADAWRTRRHLHRRGHRAATRHLVRHVAVSARFEAKGRFSEYLAAIPVYVIKTARSPAFLGAAIALDADARGAGCAA